jgi:uncharacterized protein (DUF433 family)
MTSLTMDWGIRTQKERWKAPHSGDSEERHNIVVRDPDVWGGSATVAGTRIPVFLIDDYFNEVKDIYVLLECYRSLTPADIHSALAYAHKFQGRIQEDRERHERALARLMRQAHPE